MHFTPRQNLPHRAILLVFILRYTHYPCRTISFHIIVNKNLLHVFTKPSTQNIHTFSPRTSTKIPTSRLLHDHPLPPATITFARTPPDLWTTIPQFLIFKIKVCKHSIKITPRNSSTRTSRTPTPPSPDNGLDPPSASHLSFPISTETSPSSTVGYIPQHTGLPPCQNSPSLLSISPHNVTLSYCQTIYAILDLPFVVPFACLISSCYLMHHNLFKQQPRRSTTRYVSRSSRSFCNLAAYPLFIFVSVFLSTGIARSTNIRHLCLFPYRTVLAHLSYVLSYITTHTTVLFIVLFTDPHPVRSTCSAKCRWSMPVTIPTYLPNTGIQASYSGTTHSSLVPNLSG